ncbi:unnamed protein product [Lactuca virosa]|uniref:Protein argonaute N-terminal domain-containing protein n=1 Tax=Lactuca virosa TaxID=75947 RepID=A0AAU9MVE8_9ASTR|nr:unnamed protein product [Lactuca virosa]
MLFCLLKKKQMGAKLVKVVGPSDQLDMVGYWLAMKEVASFKKVSILELCAKTVAARGCDAVWKLKNMYNQPRPEAGVWCKTVGEDAFWNVPPPEFSRPFYPFHRFAPSTLCLQDHQSIAFEPSTTAEEVEKIICFGVANALILNQRRRRHRHCRQKSLIDVSDGVMHVLLCRLILGKLEPIPFGSQIDQPTSTELSMSFFFVDAISHLNSIMDINFFLLSFCPTVVPFNGSDIECVTKHGTSTIRHTTNKDARPHKRDIISTVDSFTYLGTEYPHFRCCNVTITAEVISKTRSREILKLVSELYKQSHLGNMLLAYDGKKSAFAAGPLPFESKEFVV